MIRCVLPLLLAGCVTELPDVADPCAAWKDPGIYTMSIEVGGEKRNSWVYMPPGSTGPRDLVVALHGAGGSGRAMSETTEYIQTANANGFVLAFPNGTHPWLDRPAWNAGDCCLKADEQHRDESDVKFLNALVAELEKKTCSNRVFATGFSNGAMLAHRWACESDVVDAVVPVSGGLMVDHCEGKPIPMLHFHGADDPIVPVEGNDDVPNLRKSLQPWFDRNQCTGEDPEIVTKGKLSCEYYPCAVPTQVCILEDWPHMWPGGVNASKTGGLNATVAGWNFFEENGPVVDPTDYGAGGG